MATESTPAPELGEVSAEIAGKPEDEGAWQAARPEELFVTEESDDLSDDFLPIGGIPVDTSLPLGLDEPLPKGRFTNRELSWMDFNERVLEQSMDKDLPLLERLWFSNIFSSNLDEFYMVRVSGLKRKIQAGKTKVGVSGLAPKEVLQFIHERTRELIKRQAQDFSDNLKPALEKAKIHLLEWEQLSDLEKERMQWYFHNKVFPVLTPLAVDPAHPFPYISGLSLNIAVTVRNPLSGKRHFARLRVPEGLPRLISVDTAKDGGNAVDYLRSKAGARFILLEQVIIAHLERLFPGMEILESDMFRITRNEDLRVAEDDAENLLIAIEAELSRRRFGAVVRLEVTESMSESTRQFLVEKLEISEEDVFRLPAPLDFRVFNELHSLDVPALKFRPYVPVTAAKLAGALAKTSAQISETTAVGSLAKKAKPTETVEPVDIFQVLREQDVLVHHPYDSFTTSVQQFITQAAHDPQVLAIKQTLYRTSGDSPIVSALIEAAMSGKQVVAIVEIKARFDEKANISWARKLERAGVHVVYGMVGLKTHCKLSLAVRREGDVLRRYCHIGTGNYHPKTACGYEDLGLLTTDPVITQDVLRLFNQLSGYGPRSHFHKLLVAPVSIRSGLIERIEEQMRNQLEGKEAWIGIKVNSIMDERVIDALYRASQAGVKVDIVVRGICAVRPGIRGLSDNIRVRSILGRFLEHSRIYAFGPKGSEEVLIGSADLMHRNLDRRVEVLVQIEDREHADYLTDLLRTEADSRTSSWHLTKHGVWKRRKFDKHGKPLLDIQTELMEQRLGNKKAGQPAGPSAASDGDLEPDSGGICVCGRSVDCSCDSSTEKTSGC